MTHSHTKLSGLITLTLLAPDGTPLETHEQYNNVTAAGQNFLLNALQGKTQTKDIIPVLGNREFNTKSTDPEKDPGAVRLTNRTLVSDGVSGNVLSLSYRGDAHRKDDIVGGGVIIVSADGKKQLYNFAPTKEPIGVVKGMPVLMNVNISVGN